MGPISLIRKEIAWPDSLKEEKMKKYLIIGVMFILVFGLILLGFGDAETQEQNPWEWRLEKVKSMVEKVRAGKDLTPSSWPDGAKVAVGLSFDFDAGQTPSETKPSLRAFFPRENIPLEWLSPGYWLF